MANINKKPKTPKKKAISGKILKYLEKAGVKHEILEHRTVYSAIDAAMTLKKKIGEIAKSILVKADKDYYLVLLPADHNLDMEKLRILLGKEREKEVKVLKIPGEKIVENALKTKAEAVSAFGKLHKIGTVLDKRLKKLKTAVFAAGTPNYSVEMQVGDYIKTEEPVVGDFGVKKKIKTK